MKLSEAEMTMNEMNNSPVCERASELIEVLYGEASDAESREFELHAQQCLACRTEFAAFAEVRESIRDWRAEALAGFVSSHEVAHEPVRKSALVALRQFFALSPLWMKGAVGFAAVVFCLLAVFTAMQFGTTDQTPAIATTNPETVYTKADVERAVQEAVAQEREQRVVQPKSPIVAEAQPPKKASVAKPGPKSRRPFSKAEREQLAAELRLLADDENERYLWADPN